MISARWYPEQVHGRETVPTQAAAYPRSPQQAFLGDLPKLPGRSL
jgi:hypothetical protein